MPNNMEGADLISNTFYYVVKDTSTRVRLELIPNTFYYTVKDTTTRLSKRIIEDYDGIPWAPVVLYLGMEGAACKFLSGDQIGYWFSCLMPIRPLSDLNLPNSEPILESCDGS